MSENYKLPRSVFYRMLAEREHDGLGNAFAYMEDPFMARQIQPGDRDRALMVLPYEEPGISPDFVESIPRPVRVLLLCLMASIAEWEEAEGP